MHWVCNYSYCYYCYCYCYYYFHLMAIFRLNLVQPFSPWVLLLHPFWKRASMISAVAFVIGQTSFQLSVSKH